MSRRIVSLVPSLTELLCAIGLKEELVGCTKFCVSPPGLHKTTMLLGGTKDPDLSLLATLCPTHILVNEEENKKTDIERCERIAPTFTTFPKSPKEVPTMVSDIAEFLGDYELGKDLGEKIAQKLVQVEELGKKRELENYLYFIWKNPWMVVSPDTYIANTLKLMNFSNAVKEEEPRYPEITFSEITTLSPQILFFSSEPWPFRNRDLEEMQNLYGKNPQPHMQKIDGKLFSWYGSSTLEVLEWMLTMPSKRKG